MYSTQDKVFPFHTPFETKVFTFSHPYWDKSFYFFTPLLRQKLLLCTPQKTVHRQFENSPPPATTRRTTTISSPWSVGCAADKKIYSSFKSGDRLRGLEGDEGGLQDVLRGRRVQAGLHAEVGIFFGSWAIFCTKNVKKTRFINAPVVTERRKTDEQVKTKKGEQFCWFFFAPQLLCQKTYGTLLYFTFN